MTKVLQLEYKNGCGNKTCEKREINISICKLKRGKKGERKKGKTCLLEHKPTQSSDN